jgi:translation initiation factor RLI1
MPNKLIVLDYYKCRPNLCNNGCCVAAPSCPLGIIRQEEPYDFPMANPSVCKGCAKCVTACPLEAISLS